MYAQHLGDEQKIDSVELFDDQVFSVNSIGSGPCQTFHKRRGLDAYKDGLP